VSPLEPSWSLRAIANYKGVTLTDSLHAGGAAAPRGESFATSPETRLRMQRQPVENTMPEVAVRRALHGLGLRFRLHQAVVTGTRRRVDIVFAPSKVAVFVDGCFWHGCPDHARRAPKVNRWYWDKKLERNRVRDRDTDSRLSAAGWLVVRVWEHEDAEMRARQIASLVRKRRASQPSACRKGS